MRSCTVWVKPESGRNMLRNEFVRYVYRETGREAGMCGGRKAVYRMLPAGALPSGWKAVQRRCGD